MGGRLVRAKQAARIRKTKTRMNKYLRMGKKAGAHVFKTGAVPAMRHGVSVVGITVATMRSVNQMASRVGGSMKGARSSCARLTLAAYNPGHQMFLDTLMKWAKGIWPS